MQHSCPTRRSSDRDLRRIDQRGFLDLGERLKEADADADDQADQQHRRAKLDGQPDGVAPDVQNLGAAHGDLLESLVNSRPREPRHHAAAWLTKGYPTAAFAGWATLSVTVQGSASAASMARAAWAGVGLSALRSTL